MASLMDGVKGMMTDALVGKISKMIGIESKTATTALRMVVPAIIGGLISKGESEKGASGLLDLFKTGGFGSDKNDQLSDILGDKSKSDSWLESGADLLGTLFGDNKSSIMDKVLGSTGLNKAGGSMLMKFLAPIVVNKLAGMVFKNGWGADKLSSYLNDQKSSIAGMVPGLGSMLGFADNAASTEKAAVAPASASVTEREPSTSGGGGWWKWLLPIVIGVGLIWYLTQDGCNSANTSDDIEISLDGENGSLTTEIEGGPTRNATEGSSMTNENESTSTAVTTSTSEDAMDLSESSVKDDGTIVDANGNVLLKAGDYSLDADNNLVNNDGRILVKAADVPASLLARLKTYLGKYAGTRLTVDANGNLVNSAGSVIYKKGEYSEKNGFYYDKDGNKLGRIWAKLVKAVTEAAEQTVDAMKSMFSNMVKGVAGSKTEYNLSDIEFQTENNRISNFSKAEVEGLAAALKENSTGRIVVRAYTNDGKNDSENSELSTKRAEVVHNMLVTLGVPKGQISFKGMGSGANNVEVTTRE